MQAGHGGHVQRIERDIPEAEPILLARVDRQPGHQMETLVDISVSGGFGEAAEVPLRLLDGNDVGIGGADRLRHGFEVDLDPAVPDVEGHDAEFVRFGGASPRGESDRGEGGSENQGAHHLSPLTSWVHGATDRLAL
jgi:hypothetical protein